MKILSLIDLILVSIWGLFVVWNPNGPLPLLFPFVVIRLTMNFTLQLRQRRKSAILIAAFVAGAILTLTLPAYDMNDWILRPFAKMYDSIIMLFTGHSTLMEGAYQFLGNHGDAVLDPGVCWKIFTGCWIVWLLGAPMLAYVIQLCKHRLRDSAWNWKKIGIATSAYVTVSIIAYLCVPLAPFFLPGRFCVWCLGLMFIPLIANIKPTDSSKGARRYCIVVAIFVTAFVAGFEMNSTCSLIVMIFTTVSFYYLAVYKWRKSNPDNMCRNLSLLTVAEMIFWMAQYCTDEIKILFLSSSAVVIALLVNELHVTRNPWLFKLSTFLVCAVILPSIALGYNQYVCIDAKRVSEFNQYNYTWRGLLKVRSEDGNVAIRDRYGYITPCDFDAVEYMDNPSKPYVKYKSDGFWGVYDLERQKVMVEPKYTDILPYDNISWRLMDEYSVRYGCHDFFVSPAYYYRFGKSGTVSDCPFIHGLEDELPLKYNCEVKGAKYLDHLLTEMITKLWEKPDSLSYADFYWDWTIDINGEIKNLQSKVNVFDEDGDITSEAMLKLEEYIDPGCGGSQMEMNATSYVLSAIENYRMLQSVQDLVYRLSPIDMRREHTLFNEFMSAYEDWEVKRDEFKDWYSDRPRERNTELYCRIKDRHNSIDDMRAVMKGDTVIPPNDVVSRSTIDNYFKRLASIGNDETKELVAPIKSKFREWIEYRNQIAALMPKQIAVSYRNQTRKLEKFYTSESFQIHDEF